MVDRAQPAAGRETLVDGARFAITIDEVAGTAERCSTTYKGLPGDVRPGDVILIDDGRLTVIVVAVGKRDKLSVYKRAAERR